MENISLYIIFSIYNYSFCCTHHYPIYSSPQPSFISCLEGEPPHHPHHSWNHEQCSEFDFKGKAVREKKTSYFFHGKKRCKHPLVVQNYQTWDKLTFLTWFLGSTNTALLLYIKPGVVNIFFRQIFTVLKSFREISIFKAWPSSVKCIYRNSHFSDSPSPGLSSFEPWIEARGRSKPPSFIRTLYLTVLQSVCSWCQPAQLEQHHWCEHRAPVCKDFSEHLRAARQLAPQCVPPAWRLLWASFGVAVTQREDINICSAWSSCSGFVVQSTALCPGLNDFTDETSIWWAAPDASTRPASTHTLVLCSRAKGEDSPFINNSTENPSASLKDGFEW